jgi:hypothetical protein
MNLSIAIDFSFHNGTDFRNKNSLHYQDARKRNPYELCLNGLTPNLAQYNEEYRLYGYSAVPPSEANMGTGTSNSFPLSWDIN